MPSEKLEKMHSLDVLVNVLKNRAIFSNVYKKITAVPILRSDNSTFLFYIDYRNK